MTSLKQSFQYGNHTITLETGEIARQADGAVLVNMADTVIVIQPYSIYVPILQKDFD